MEDMDQLELENGELIEDIHQFREETDSDSGEIEHFRRIVNSFRYYR